MIIKQLYIDIPASARAPATTIYLKIVLQDEQSSQTKPFAFILPGGPGANHSHYQAYECLSDTTNLIFYDPRGCGFSGKSDANTYTMNNYLDDLKFIQDHLEIERANIIGKSYGAKCALAYALRYPQSVDKLVIVSGSPNNKNRDTAKANLVARGTLAQQAIAEKLWQGTFQSPEELSQYFAIMKPLYSFKTRHGVVEPVGNPKLPYCLEALNKGFSSKSQDFDLEEKLKDIECPTLIIVGEEDWITSPQHSRLMADNIPNSQLAIIAEADHKIEYDQPELFFGTLRDFIASPKKHYDWQFFNQDKSSFQHTEKTVKQPVLSNL